MQLQIVVNNELERKEKDLLRAMLEGWGKSRIIRPGSLVSGVRDEPVA